MFERIANGWELAGECWNALRLDKELLVFPFLSGICGLLVLASFGIPLWFSPYAAMLFEDGAIPEDPVAYVILFAFYAVNYFVIVFFNSALVACALIRFRGGDPTLADGFRASFQRLPQIFAWSLVSATIGLALRLVESRSEKAGRFFAALAGAGWTIATFFVIPVLVVERVGPIQAIGRSLSILRRTWGESVSAHFSIGFFVFLAGLLAAMPLVGGILLLTNGQMPAGGALIVLGVAALMGVSLVSSALNSILLAALYLYAADGAVPRNFDDRLLRSAFGPNE